ncbi:MAG: YraN family protein [Opitutales bacterium]
MQRRGDQGEQAAAAWLQRRLGIRCLLRNWRAGRDEIDLICREGEVLVFVEVKTRSPGRRGTGFRSVNRRKRRAQRRAARAYLRALASPPRHFRFDVVEVVPENGNGITFHHHRGVALFRKRTRP